MNRALRTRIYWWISMILPAVILLGTAIYLGLIWKDIPAEIPTHFDFSGEPNGWGGKAFLWVLLAIGFIIYLSLAIAAFFPQSWNTGVRVTEANQERVYRLAGELLGDMRLMFAVLFSYLTVQSTRPSPSLGWPMTVLILALVFIPLLRYFLRLLVFMR